MATRTIRRQASRQFRGPGATSAPCPAGRAPGRAAPAERDWLMASSLIWEAPFEATGHSRGLLKQETRARHLSPVLP